MIRYANSVFCGGGEGMKVMHRRHSAEAIDVVIVTLTITVICSLKVYLSSDYSLKDVGYSNIISRG